MRVYYDGMPTSISSRTKKVAIVAYGSHGHAQCASTFANSGVKNVSRSRCARVSRSGERRQKPRKLPVMEVTEAANGPM